MGGITNIINLDSNNTIWTGAAHVTQTASSGTSASVMPSMSVGEYKSCRNTGYNKKTSITAPSGGAYRVYGWSADDESIPSLSLSAYVPYPLTSTSIYSSISSRIVSGGTVITESSSDNYYYRASVAIAFRIQ